MSEQSYEHMREAIGVMTAWTSTNGVDVTRYAADLIAAGEDEPERLEKVVDLITGLINLCGAALQLHENQTGQTVEQQLQQLARWTVNQQG